MGLGGGRGGGADGRAGGVKGAYSLNCAAGDFKPRPSPQRPHISHTASFWSGTSTRCILSAAADLALLGSCISSSKVNNRKIRTRRRSF